MVTVDAITRGITRYLDSEILPQLPPAKAVMVGTVAALYLKQSSAFLDKVPEYLDIRKGSLVDLDTIKEVVKSQMKSEVPIDIPFVGRFTIDSSEVDKICRYIISES